MNKFGARLDARNGKNETPAHICARRNPARRMSLAALRFLHDVAPNSFNILDANNQKPEDIAQMEKNQAELFFANLKKKKAEETEKILKAKNDLLKEETEVAKKCQDSFRKRVECRSRGPRLDVDWFGLDLVGFISPHRAVIRNVLQLQLANAARFVLSPALLISPNVITF